ncbi:MAG: AsmA family protein [Alphaproteobacteria bacterium]|nr:AsmA family protein [Alphaproteobacteria bacterium]
MTRKKKFLVFARVVFMFFMVLGVAIVIALAKMDMNSLRSNLLGVLRSSTGLPIEITGDVSWKLSLRPRVTMHGVSIPNEANAKHKNLFEADTIEVGLNLISLFSNRPTIQRIRVNDAKIFVDKNANGKYEFIKKSEDDKNANTADSDVQGEEEHAEEQPEYPFVDPGFGMLAINNFEANIDGQKYHVSQLSFRAANRAKKREYSGWVKLEKTLIPFIISFDKYNAERKVYPVKVAFSSDGDALIADVALEGTSKIPIDFILKGDIPDVTPIGEFLGIKLPKMPEISVNIAGGFGHEKLTLHKSSIAVRGSDITISGTIDWSKKITDINANLSSKRINLLELFPEIYRSSKHPANYKPNVFKDMPLFGSFLYNKRINLNVDLGRLIVYRNLSLDNMKVGARVRDNIIRITANTVFADGNIKAAIDGNIEASGKMNLEMGGIGRGITIGKLLEQINTNNFISELPVDFEIYVRASGSDMSQIMKTITGPVRVYSSNPGYAHSDLVAYMYGADFLTTLRHNIQDMFSSEKKYDQMKINGVVANLKLRNGLAETRNGVAIETNAIDIMLDGSLDLGREEMKLSLTTIPVRGIKLSLSGNVVNTIVISGNLAEPDISISGAAVAGKALSATGLGLLLAPLTGGIGLVAGAGVGLLAGDLLSNWLADDHPCGTALKKGAPAHRGDPEWLDLPVIDLANGVINPKSGQVSDK